jgi:hypothetical protein
VLWIAHRFDADPNPDPNFQVYADTYLDPNWNQNNADPHADPTLSFKHMGKIRIFILLVTTLPVYNVLSISSVSNVA